MPGIPSDYLVEVPYPPQFHREHSPLWLDTVLTALGQQQRSGGSASWCEIGCGSGLGLIILAAANPETSFHGIDVNPAHIEQARSLAERSGVTNIRFHCADLRNIADMPEFDYIIAHGIYSWVSPEVREAIRWFMGGHLKADGVALLHYLTLPGAADSMAFHALFRAVHQEHGASPADAVDQGNDILTALQTGHSGFFAAHPLAVGMARQIALDEPNYTAHDYLNDDYAPQSSAQVIRAMQDEGLSFVGSASPMDNLDDFTIPGNLRRLFAAQKSVAMREAIRDMASNQFSRMDLYRRGPRSMQASEHFAGLRRLRFTRLNKLPPEGGVMFETRIGKIEGPSEIFSPILERLGSGSSVPYEEIETAPVFQRNPGLLNQALHALMGAGYIHPVAEDRPEAANALALASKLNDMLIGQCRSGQRIPALAAPALASGVALLPDHLTALFNGEELPCDLQRLLPLSIQG